MASLGKLLIWPYGIQRGIYTTFWLEASSPQAKMWSERLALGRQNAHHSCPAGRDLRRADPSTRGATAPQRAQRVKFCCAMPRVV